MRDSRPDSSAAPAQVDPDGFRLRLRRLARRITGGLILAYLLFLACVWAGTRLVGERNLTTAFLLYLPPGVWVLPAVFLAPLGLRFHRKGFCAMCGFFCLAIWFWAGYRPGLLRTAGTSSDSPDVLTVLTYNFGQNSGTSFQPFKNATRPDLIVMQEAAGRADGYLRAPGYSEFGHGLSIGEFTLLSRFPIKESSLLPACDASRNAPAARFVIDWNGRQISVYAVHLMTPRGALGSYMRGAFLLGIIGLPGTPWAEKRRHYQSFWDMQFAEAGTILRTVAGDTNPCLLAGDFNAPSPGQIHSTMTNQFGDAHAAVGRGFGFTFPGRTHNPLSLGGPWLRIDYVFFDRQWKAVECVTEKNRESQHRAVMAKLRFLPGIPAQPAGG